MFRIVPVKLLDCHQHGPGSGAELFLVEGDSASKAVAKARSPVTQAVLPMQGKPLNAYKARKSVVARNELFMALVDAIGTGWGDDVDLAAMRYDRVILLFDPDADGHSLRRVGVDVFLPFFASRFGIGKSLRGSAAPL
jgi:DNA gyrase subunit B